MKKPAVLKLNGKPFSMHNPTPTESKIIAFLSAAPADEIFTSDEVAKRAGIPKTAVQNRGIGDSEFLNGYSHLAGRCRYWGNPKAIGTLREQLAGEQ